MIYVFSGYNLELDEKTMMETLGDDYYDYIEIGKKHLQSGVNHFKNKLRSLISLNTINGNELEECCFPNIDADIFLSHSHKDCDLANALAGWIHKKFGLNVFVDSNVWEYSSELLEEINSHYSNKRSNGNKGYLYNHESCCKASEHVNTMLTSALHKMIDKVECVILLNTDNSVRVFEDDCFASTYSPWIYSEIMSTQIVRKKPLICYREYNELMHFDESTVITYDSTNFIIFYTISLKHLVPIKWTHLLSWLNNYSNSMYKEDYPLDSLYTLTYKNHVEITKRLCRLIYPDQIDKIKKYFEGELDEPFDIANIIQMLTEEN